MTTLVVATSTLDIVIVVVVVLIGLLAAGGWAAGTRRSRAREHKLLGELHVAEQELARARATDKGWDRALLERAARDAVAARFGSEPVDALQLVQVIDRPGTDADQAVFRVQTADGGEHRITLGRTGGVWGPA
jgi:type II secretory pathway pseudopilin PulG